MALMPSALPRLVASVESVSQALKQASLAELPKKVIRQSSPMVRLMHRPYTGARVETAGKKMFWMVPCRIREKLQMEMPQRI